ncbi:hypothetical protein D3C75_1107920 [compost metagenome]
MATKPECHQIRETPAIGGCPLPFQPGFALVRIQHKALERQRLTLGSEPLALAGAFSTLGIDFGKPELGFTVIEFANGHESKPTPNPII